MLLLELPVPVRRRGRVAAAAASVVLQVQRQQRGGRSALGRRFADRDVHGTVSVHHSEKREKRIKHDFILKKKEMKTNLYVYNEILIIIYFVFFLRLFERSTHG